jgi:curved DNA-binding protein CbpA
MYQFTTYSHWHKYTKPRILQYCMHNSTSKIRFHPSSNLQYQLWVRMWPEITCKDTLGNSNNEISTLQVMHKNLKLTGSNNFISNIKSIISLSKNLYWCYHLIYLKLHYQYSVHKIKTKTSKDIIEIKKKKWHMVG